MQRVRIQENDVIQVDPGAAGALGQCPGTLGKNAYNARRIAGCFGRVLAIGEEATKQGYILNGNDFVVEFPGDFGDRLLWTFKFSDLGMTIERVGRAVWGR